VFIGTERHADDPEKHPSPKPGAVPEHAGGNSRQP